MTEYSTRFMHEVGVRAYLRVFWGKTVWKDKQIVSGECPNSYGHGGPGIHNARIFVADKLDGYDEDFGGREEDFAEERWPTRCDHCEAVVPPPERVPCNCGVPDCTKPAEGSRVRQVFRRVLYQAADGDRAVRDELVPGDCYWATWYGCGASGHCHHRWTNCDGKHLMVVCPSNGGTHPWDVMGRASNCALPEDTLHRCWVLHGNPETDRITVDKSGLTCGAGGGSIQVPGWHGVLSGGILRQC